MKVKGKKNKIFKWLDWYNFKKNQYRTAQDLGGNVINHATTASSKHYFAGCNSGS